MSKLKDDLKFICNKETKSKLKDGLKFICNKETKSKLKDGLKFIWVPITSNLDIT